jgi:excinuclease ABC subunit C
MSVGERLPFARESVERLPEAPGVYLFLDGAQRVLYVGKARDLRARVRTYFGSGDDRLVGRLIHRSARTLDFVLTGDEREALLLENSLIKRERPRLNIRLTDDKTYFHLRLDRRAPWPRLVIVRRPRPDGALHFGPYTSAQACRRTIQFLSAVFPLRTCPDAVLHNRVRPCMLHEIGRCSAPCVGLVTAEAYAVLVERTLRFLSGQDAEVTAELRAEMEAAAARLDFERAAAIRDQLRAIEMTVDLPRAGRGGGPDRDVIGVHEAGREAVVAVLEIRDGLLRGSHHYRVRRLGGTDELLGAVLGQHYGPDRRPPAEILIPALAADLELHRGILEGMRGAAVQLRVPERGEGGRLLRLAEANAESRASRDAAGREEAGRVRSRLRELLRLAVDPSRIEGYDISHHGGEEVVGSQVTFVDGEPVRRHFRRYRLREVQRNDDFAAMAEVLVRRIRRGLRDGDLPDLILLDGGPPQLQRAMEVLGGHGAIDVELAALAKARPGGPVGREAQHERVWRPFQARPVILDLHSPEALLLLRIRDEAHRVAHAYGRERLRRGALSSVLELAPGIGRRRARALLAAFGSVSALRRAPLDALAGVPGMTRRGALDLQRWFAENPGLGGASPGVDSGSG